MAMDFYWIDGPWTGKLAVAPRPRGGDWLEDDVLRWRSTGFHAVISLLTSSEEVALDLSRENDLVEKNGMKFLSLPIPDRDVPNSETEVASILEALDKRLTAGENVLIHCRQGIGRSGLIAACLLINQGMDPEDAVTKVSQSRGLTVPETAAQRRWIDHYREVLSAPKTLPLASRAPNIHP